RRLALLGDERGEREREPRRSAGLALDPDPATVQLDEALGDVEPEPQAPRRFLRQWTPPAAIEHVRNIRRADAFSFVRHRRADFSVAASDLDVDRRPGYPVLVRVGDQVAENLLEAVSFRAHERYGRIGFDADGPRRHARSERIGHAASFFSQVES